MTAAWTTVVCTVPPVICVAIDRAWDAAKGIDENRTFSVNVPSVKQMT
jgi:flavin reductase (DIM6/NTAB) family NADH-FMN oxidoreductase RutF